MASLAEIKDNCRKVCPPPTIYTIDFPPNASSY